MNSTTVIGLDEVTCDGDEVSLADCDYVSDAEDMDCVIREAVSLVCDGE